MKSLFVLAIAISASCPAAFAAKPLTVILPGSKITFTKTIEFQNTDSHPSYDVHIGPTVKVGEWGNQYCSIAVQLGAGAKGRISAGRTYVTVPLSREQEYANRDQIALSDKVTIDCNREKLFDDGYDSANVTVEALTRSLTFLKVEPKKAPDEEL